MKENFHFSPGKEGKMTPIFPQFCRKEKRGNLLFSPGKKKGYPLTGVKQVSSLTVTGERKAAVS